VKSSVLLRLLRHGLNACELAFYAETSEMEMRRTIRTLERTVARRVRKRLRDGKPRSIRLAP
jgi:hypothetical protein